MIASNGSAPGGFIPGAEVLLTRKARLASVAFVGVTIAGLLTFVLIPWIQVKLGIRDHGIWFLDSYAVLAGSDAALAGLDAGAPNPLDVLQRPHSYSDWWFVLGQWGFDRTDNFLVGGTWVLAFLAVVWLTLRPRDFREAAWFGALVLSPPVLLAINRANNDLVIFALLGVAAIALRYQRRWDWVVALTAIALATGLKFYPVVAAGVFILIRPPKRKWVALLVSALVLAWVLYNIWPTLGRGAFSLPRTLHTFGGAVLLREFLGDGPKLVVITSALVLLGGVGLMKCRDASGLADAERAPDRRILFTLGGIVLVACFIAGASFAYRCIFALWLAPWLSEEARDAALSERRRALARFGGWLLFGTLWADGIYCLFVNVVIGPLRPPLQGHVQLVWRVLTQPLAWALVVLVAAWLISLVVAAWRDPREPART